MQHRANSGGVDLAVPRAVTSEGTPQALMALFYGRAHPREPCISMKAEPWAKANGAEDLASSPASF